MTGKLLKKALTLLLAAVLSCSGTAMTVLAQEDAPITDSAQTLKNLALDQPVPKSTEYLKIMYGHGTEEVQPGETLALGLSYNLPEGNFWRETIDITSSRQISGVSLQEAVTGFSVDLEGAVQGPNSEGLWNATIHLDFSPSSYKPDDQPTASVVIAFQDNTTAQFNAKVDVTDYPHVYIVEDSSSDFDRLEVGKSYSPKAKLRDKANTLAGKTITYHWEIKADATGMDASCAELSASTGEAITLIAKKAGQFALWVGVEADGARITSFYAPFTVVGGTIDALPDTDIEDAFANPADGKVEITVPDGGGLSSENFAAIKAAAAANGSVTKVTLPTNSDKVSLSFDPTLVNPDNLSGNFSPRFTNSNPYGSPSEYQTLSGTWLDFTYSGSLPAPMTVSIKLDPSFSEVGAFKVWYFNTQTNRLEQKDYAVTVVDGVASFTLDHFSAYIMLPDTVDPNAGLSGGSSGGSSSGGGSSGGGGSSSDSTPKSLLGGGLGKMAQTTAALSPADAAKVGKLAETALAMAKASGSKVATVSLKNVSSISGTILKQLATTANKAGVGITLTSDVVKGKVVESRIYIDPEKTTLASGLKLGVTLGDAKLEAKLAKSFSNTMRVIAFEQTGSLGMPVKAAVRIDLKGLDAKTLQLYSYDAKTNKLSVVNNAACSVDANGYLRFATTIGGTLVVTDHALTKK